MMAATRAEKIVFFVNFKFKFVEVFRFKVFLILKVFFKSFKGFFGSVCNEHRAQNYYPGKHPVNLVRHIITLLSINYSKMKYSRNTIKIYNKIKYVLNYNIQKPKISI